ncbi:MAG: ATP-binding protein [Candidatus Pacebacteria bacterium]|nr:ATP-binding protein [Candidatus Paceibacterota bacterium]
MNTINRSIEPKIRKNLFKGKVVIIYGARQVGKTTLSKKILADFKEDGKYLNCELASVQQGLSVIEAERIKSFLGDYKLVVFDEAQNIKDIGKILKVMVDTYPDIQIIATGSSSFDLADKISEPFTGRNFTYLLYPLSIREVVNQFDAFYGEAKIESILRFGFYPEVFSLSDEQAKDRLDEISSNYLYRDILRFDGIKKTDVVNKLLMLLALQLGQEVSYIELGRQLGINRLTVEKYIDLLEKSFIVFKLRSFSRNKRKEISKSVKIYFYDIGIRNSLIQNYNPLEMRDDIGALWENFCIVERKKLLEEKGLRTNSYFWRTYSQKEIDYVEESEGKIAGYEFKWNSKKTYRLPKDFVEKYDAKVEIINRDNFWKFFDL